MSLNVVTWAHLYLGLVPLQGVVHLLEVDSCVLTEMAHGSNFTGFNSAERKSSFYLSNLCLGVSLQIRITAAKVQDLNRFG